MAEEPHPSAKYNIFSYKLNNYRPNSQSNINFIIAYNEMRTFK